MVAVILIIGLIYVGGIANFTGRAMAWNIRQMMIGGLYGILRPTIFTLIGMMGLLLYSLTLPDSVKPSVLISIAIIAFIAALMEVVIMIYVMATGKERPELPYT